ncbi:PAS fold family [Richelia sinica FACHB-800]|uniref:histidine kinase n=1 Tax=Richelia sinica FACHB-800 TaxID=1357546 RepID=A0A975TB82_9NOST|nr:PAS domain S-box protein [Richelia sinica]MBD2667158.1 PAS domain S-box protein [Richelia sinica FACHB-800]QXE25608.1 PAS fold family [Richelia sinica FACHB-800]
MNFDLHRKAQQYQFIEQELCHSQQTLRDILNSLFTFVAIISVDGILIEINRASLETLNLTTQDVMGQPFAQIYCFAYSPSIQQQLVDAIAQAGQGQIVRYNTSIQIAQSKLMMLDVSINPIFNEQGQIIYLVASGVDITPRQEVEQTLQIQLNAIEAATDGIAILQDEQFLYLNQAHVQMFGYKSAEELIGKTWRELYQPSEIASLQSQVFPILTQAGHWRGETKAKRKDGTIFDEELSLSFIGANQLICVCRDISDSKRAALALKESEQRFRQLAENLHLVFWMTNPEQKKSRFSEILYVSPAYEKIWGVPCENLYSNPQSFLDSIHPDDKNLVMSTVKKEKSGFDIEYRIIPADGSIRWIHDQAFPIINEQGEVYRVVGAAEDITEQKKSAVALQQSQQFLRQVIDTNPNLIFVQDWEGKYILVNQALADIYGTTVEDIIGKKETDLHAKQDDIEAYLTINRQVITSLQKQKIPERVITTHTGETRYFQVVISPLVDTEGKVSQILGVANDITERKQAEQKISEALKQEKQLSELKSRFISMTSHEFRTPLAVISSSASILQQFSQKLQEEQKQKHLQCILTYVKHTTQLLDDILLINKAETGKLSFYPEPVDVVSFCQQLVEDVQLSATHHQIIFFSQISTPIIANLDKKLLRQILINLLGNGIKYSPEESQVIFNFSIEAENLVFSIEDKGMGILPQDQSQLFESFHRGANVGNIPGTGLGLAIVAKCIALHQGQITFTSQIGVGTTFTAYIPYNIID